LYLVDKLKQIEALVNKLEFEKSSLETKIQCENISHKLALEEKVKTISNLIESKAVCTFYIYILLALLLCIKFLFFI
jgi:hypothetical protein